MEVLKTNSKNPNISYDRLIHNFQKQSILYDGDVVNQVL